MGLLTIMNESNDSTGVIYGNLISQPSEDTIWAITS